MGLVLTRKYGERIAIGDRIVITISNHNSNRVKLHIVAPPEMGVVRLPPEIEVEVRKDGELRK